jgi:hypothetical protein
MEKQLQGQLRLDSNLSAWFESLKQWGADSWSQYAPHYRGYELLKGEKRGHDMRSVGFMQSLLPGFDAYLDPEELFLQQRMLSLCHDLSGAAGVEFHLAFPFPLFPVQDLEAVCACASEYLNTEGQIDIYNLLLPELLKNVCRTYVSNLPEIRRLDVWICEGCGEIIKVSREDLRRNVEWFPQLVHALDEVCRELAIEGMVFAHDFFHTTDSRRTVHRTLSKYPDILIMEDLTWPEESGAMPFMGFIPKEQRLRLFDRSRVKVNCLTDTEYTGQGLLPYTPARWWKQAASGAEKAGAFSLGGRCGFWDNGRTAVSFNRLNAYMLLAFADDPGADPCCVLREAAVEMFGPLPESLIQIMDATEEIARKVFLINSVSALDHSRFPRPEYIDRRYTEANLRMHAVDDLFCTPGTRCYTRTGGECLAGEQWRRQMEVRSRPVAEYLEAKDSAIEQLEAWIPEIDDLTTALCREHGELFRVGYRNLLFLAKGMHLFIRAAHLHFNWIRHPRNQNHSEKAKALVQEYRDLASSADFPVLHGYDTGMLRNADFLEQTIIDNSA